MQLLFIKSVVICWVSPDGCGWTVSKISSRSSGEVMLDGVHARGRAFVFRQELSKQPKGLFKKKEKKKKGSSTFKLL